MTVKKLADAPISVSLGILIIIIFILYTTQVIKDIPECKTVHSTLCSHFVHIEMRHLLANLLALYALARVESVIGSKQFILLILFLVVFTSLIETILHKWVPNIPVSVGLSGILFGIMSWEIMTYKDAQVPLLISIGVMILSQAIYANNISIAGHLIGAIVGILGGILWKSF